ncbi:glycosyltransferase [Elusimicrobiota bacterium]
MRILHLDFELTFRGAENQLMLLHKHLLAENIESAVITARDSAFAQNARKSGTKNVRTLARSALKIGEFDPMLSLKVLREVNSFKPSIIHCHSAHAAGIVFMAKAFLPGSIKIIFRRAVSNRIGAFSRFKYESAHCLIAVCEAAKNELVDRGVSPGRIKIIHSGIIFPGNGKRARKDNSGRLNLGTLCALDKKQKDVQTLIKAADTLKSKGYEFNLEIHGDGPDLDRLKDLSSSLKLEDSVHFAGWSDDINASIAALDIFVMPSLEEGTSNALITAMSLGLPCIATAAGGNPEVLKDAGLLTRPADSTDLAQALSSLIDSADLRISLGDTARSRSQDFSFEKTFQKTLNCYKELLKH